MMSAQSVLDSSIHARIQRTPLFSAWPEGAFAALLEQARVRRLDLGEILFHEGEEARAFYFLLDGEVDLISLGAGGREKIVEIIQVDDLFAEAVAFLGGRYPVQAAAGLASTVVEIPFAPFMTTLQGNQELMPQMLARLSMRLHYLIKELRHLSMESANQRVASYLLDLCPAGGECVEISLPAKKAAVAARLGLTPETFSRVLGRLRKAGLLRVDKRSLQIPDPQALRRWADSS